MRPPDARAPDFRLRDQDGKPVAMADYRGRTVVMTFVYSTCKDTCPARCSRSAARSTSSATTCRCSAVSVDPKQDTRARAKAFLLKQHVTGRVRYVLGTQAELAPVWRGYGIAPQRGSLDHSAYVVLVDAPRPPAHRLPHSELTPEGLASDLRRLD